MMGNVISLADARQAKAISNNPPLNLESDNTFKCKQLSLSFEVVKRLLLVDVRDFAGQDDFRSFCAKLKPGVVVDLRVAPRLDFIRPSRKQAFKLFDELSLEYVDVLGRLNIFSSEVSDAVILEIINTVDKLTEQSIAELGPIIALTDNAIFAKRCLAKMVNIFDASLLDSDHVKPTTIAQDRQQM